MYDDSINFMQELRDEKMERKKKFRWSCKKLLKLKENFEGKIKSLKASLQRETNFLDCSVWKKIIQDCLDFP